MGRYSKGAITTGEVTRIELSYLLKNGFIKAGKNRAGQISWTNDSNIGIECSLNDKYYWYVRFNYKNTNTHTGEVTNQDYKIYLTSIP